MLFASEWKFHFSYIYFVLGLYLVIASACVLNNAIDKDIDSLMERTKKRAIPNGDLPVRKALTLAIVLAGVGFWLLMLTNWTTFTAVAIGFITYVVIYGAAKRRTVHSTLIGTVPGGASIVAGYTAVRGELDLATAILFFSMLSWQMAHFFAIGIYRLRDYKAAKMPILPAKKGIAKTKAYILVYIGLFGLVTVYLSVAGYSGYVYFLAMLGLSVAWLVRGILKLKSVNSDVWARDIFKFSLVVLLTYCAILSLASILP